MIFYKPVSPDSDQHVFFLLISTLPSSSKITSTVNDQQDWNVSIYKQILPASTIAMYEEAWGECVS